MDRSQELEKKSTQLNLTPFITYTDDDTSTESSDTSETWTVVTDKQNGNKPDKVKYSDNRIEILQNREPDNEKENDVQEEKVQDQQLQDCQNDVNDLSDGISVISESESIGRISPHPYLRDHLQDLNLKFSTSDTIEDVILNRLSQETPIVLKQHQSAQQQLRKRRRSPSTPPPNKEDQALEQASQTLALSSEFRPLVKRGLQGIFYVGVALAILALIGKIVNPTWQPLPSVVRPSASSDSLEQKVSDMELQNNLMRAEIDLLNKQVKYLSSLNDPQQPKEKYKDYKQGKTFKAWSGNGDSLKPVDITKADLKRPYKCPDGSYVEIANMCLEQRPHEPSIVDQFGQVVDDMKQQSEAFKTFEKVAEELQGFQDNAFEKLEKILTEDSTPQQPTNEFIKNKPIYQTPEDFKQKLPYKDYQKPISNLDHNQQPPPYKQAKYDRSQGKYEDSSKPSKDYKKSFGKESNTENKESKRQHNKKPQYQEEFEKLRDNLKEGLENIRDNSKEHFEKFRDNMKESFKKLRDNQGEKFQKFKDNFKFRDNSKERKGKQFDDSKESKENYSKERFNGQKRKFDKNDEDSGEWQEKYMKHREQQRKENEQKYQNNKNWYIKRGDSRENKRSGEKQFR